MNWKLMMACLAGITLASCHKKNTTPTSDIEVATTFIKDVLNNDFKDAKTLVLPEEMNNQYFELAKKDFENKSPQELAQYQKAVIIINELKNVNDSLTIVNYSTSYKKTVKSEVKVVRKNGQWLVDLKHTFQTDQIR